MTRVDASLPEPLAALLEAAVDDGLFKGSSDAARVALREHFDDEARLRAVQALVDAHPPDGDDPKALTATEVVRLTGQLPPDLPDEIQTVYDFPESSRLDAEATSELAETEGEH